MTDLELQLRSALRAKTDGVSQSMLRPPLDATGETEVVHLRPSWHPSRHRRRYATVLAAAAVAAVLALAIGITVAGRGGGSQPAPVQPALNRSQVPWSQVGNGWTLVLLATGKTTQTLYLVDPAGQHYSITSLPTADLLGLSGWERDRGRAILFTAPLGQPDKKMTVVDLRTGDQTELSGAKLNYQHFAGPADHTIVNAGPLAAEAFSDTGGNRVSFAGDTFHGSAVSPDGSQVAFGSARGITEYGVDSPAPARTLSQPSGYRNCVAVAWTDALGLLGTCESATGSGVVGDFIFSAGRAPAPVDPRLPADWRAVRFTGGEIAFQHPDPTTYQPRDNTYARVLAGGRLQRLTLPAPLHEDGWRIAATTSADFMLTRSSSTGEDATATDLARWNPLSGAFTVIQHVDGGPQINGFLPWNSYFDS